MEFTLQTSQKFELINITDQIQKAVEKSGIKEGAALVFVPHTTAAVITSEDESGLKQDFYNLFKEYLNRSYHHPDGNAEAHILAGIIGHSRIIPVKSGKLDLGTWQSVLLAELDGPRQRRVTVTVLPI
ncbi:hypothetical protein COT70_02240 [candidate division WWE3 bacterium CG09_land_8_20_14_0_10_47_33]|uniref:Secondary thiamine-phosphate synthase enzyme n=1 Tax=candidate division WWE3 bacterium CG_4_9_14_0_2_um_filter_48_10 TaxID=1975078 RepID=A0A2M8EK21_UNCKA|nr:MAG: hypothetical protein COT70_02240 [candidate division WWE3 bacterium CG09_land_8_20_14_0_10_47_33]PIZ41061.1 MAG: hypothetical protein COY35_01150 [candidate division WWE3 bacterium CG_4_10_14_0_2_um_filter_47_8]PJC23093.1 MAG: hypothetical protein CO059_00600 [candidate division WWE3 bacterium CG_4_9_14_0_2_um_filter_48_10]PJE51936.1 MAG: hypothetical protein COV28_01325 [candidate division WWE3 bacterium CG10_big_fil_rev_8_21_14_0_10_48_23]